MNINELIFLNALNSIPGVGVATLRLLQNQLGSFATAWRADLHDLAGGTFHKPIHHIIDCRASLDPEKEFKKLEQHGIWIITEHDPSFPSPLREIPQPPIMLYGRGEKLNEQNIMIGIVGTRRPTTYGVQAAQQLGEQVARAGMTIVSGLAVGIDTIAHKAALENHTPTIAVVGSGLHPAVLFPSQNIPLADHITNAGGTIISEYAPQTPAAREYFPLRNRIISGLSRGILVIEARERSGALITARIALEQNRDVFALPGSIFSPTSLGANRLIQEGAKLVLHADDICQDWGLPLSSSPALSLDALDNDARTVINLLEQEMTLDEVCEKIQHMDTPQVMSLLSLLELKGYIKSRGNNSYQKI
ncbi:MAG: DNA processing protein [Parcubacteria group bacterium Gr01-1014_66]|nr:MAG: DNA processing protein [Parcubacteria group bacterium Gr01-1014_66]